MCRELKPRNLQALLLDAAVWLCCDEEVAHKLDTLCFGNLDGGVGTAAFVRQVLEGAGQAVQGDRAVRLSLDEAFFMAYALEILEVHELPQQGAAGAGAPAVALDITVGGCKQCFVCAALAALCSTVQHCAANALCLH